MIIKRIAISLLFLSAFLYRASFADAPVWKLSKGDDYIYIAGTVHMLARFDFPLPSALEVAYKDSDYVVFETDLGEM